MNSNMNVKFLAQYLHISFNTHSCTMYIDKGTENNKNIFGSFLSGPQEDNRQLTDSDRKLLFRSICNPSERTFKSLPPSVCRH